MFYVTIFLTSAVQFYKLRSVRPNFHFHFCVKFLSPLYPKIINGHKELYAPAATKEINQSNVALVVGLLKSLATAIIILDSL